MQKYWDKTFGLNYELSIWVEEEELGKAKVISHRNKRYAVKIPHEIPKETTIRLRGLGKIRGHQTGNLLLYAWLNKGEDVRRSLWLSKTSVRNGAEKKLLLDDKHIAIVIPAKSNNGLTILLRGLGREPSYILSWTSLPRHNMDQVKVELSPL